MADEDNGGFFTVGSPEEWVVFTIDGADLSDYENIETIEYVILATRNTLDDDPNDAYPNALCEFHVEIRTYLDDLYTEAYIDKGPTHVTCGTNVGDGIAPSGLNDVAGITGVDATRLDIVIVQDYPNLESPLSCNFRFQFAATGTTIG